MKLTFDDSSYIEFTYKDNKINILLCGKDNKNKNNLIANSVEITLEEFLSCVEEIKKLSSTK